MTTGLDQDPEPLELRARPRPVRRFNRRALMIGCSVAALFVGGAILIALRPHSFRPSGQTELYNTDRKQTAEELSKLPKSYEELPPSTPRLGPPSPGDIGRAFAENEKKAGVASDAGFRTNPEEDAERAERIRQTRIAQQAKESGLFFRLSEKQEKHKQKVRWKRRLLPHPHSGLQRRIQGRPLPTLQRRRKRWSIDPARSFLRPKRENSPSWERKQTRKPPILMRSSRHHPPMR
ncbi:hypothetical protein HAP47_0026310 [Bradyrhizobium sp. 41S5]|uniref:hypothetical protein n=1 Tax=Bradyrhizobium sp. 41S5 TaxID=1404443 RepID=UPI001E3870ED|nr:hypothetical protein [Bradyrhizobium sp. 41S5]UFX42735.1 hypothetical protein HAP47_0026310 [Bradyrhizobium sp. 41S5]